MNSFTKVCIVLVFIAGCTLGEYSITESNTDSDFQIKTLLSMMDTNCTPSVVRDCTVKPAPLELSLRLLQLEQLMQPCFFEVKNKSTILESELSEARQSNLYRPFVQNYCDISARSTECIYSVTNSTRYCVCEIETDLMMLSTPIIEAHWSTFCADQGERFSKFFENDGIKFWMETHDNETRQCVEGADFLKVLRTKVVKTDVPDFLWKKYNQTQSLKECLTEIGEGHTVTMDFVKDVIDAQLDVMRCINGTDLQNLVLCKDLSNSVH